MLEPIVIIPARFGSSRFPGKPLTLIRGADGVRKPLLQRTWEAAKASGFRTIVATDDDRVADLATSFDAEVFITKYTTAKNGTERCAIFASFNQRPWSSVIINLQGDACLTPPEWLHAIADEMTGGMGARTVEHNVATIVAPIHTAYGPVRAVPDSAVVVYTDVYGMAYYFGRERHGRRHHLPEDSAHAHFGVYAYTAGALKDYIAAGPAPLEEMEDLEQNRWAHLGVPVRAVCAPEGVRVPLTEVNTPEDVALVERELAKWEIS